MTSDRLLLKSVHVVDPVAELVDQDPIADVEGRLHRAGRDVEGLDQEGLDDDRNGQGGQEQSGQFGEERTPAFRRLGDRLLVDGARIVRDQSRSSLMRADFPTRSRR